MSGKQTSAQEIRRAETSTISQKRQRTFVPTPGTVADQLRQRLLALEYPAFARCLCVLLEAFGYEEARPAGRQEWKGYNRPGGGGYDLEAVLPGGLAPRLAVAQIKQFDGLNVHQRSVDELRGACLRRGGAEAVLITTSAFSQVVLKRAAELGASGTLVAPVRLIDGKELLGLLIRHRLGVREIDVRERAHGGAYRLEIDEAFFQKMSAFKAEVGQSATAKPVPSAPKPQRVKTANTDIEGDENLQWKMTIYLRGNGDFAEEKALKKPSKKSLKKGGR